MRWEFRDKFMSGKLGGLETPRAVHESPLIALGNSGMNRGRNLRETECTANFHYYAAYDFE